MTGKTYTLAEAIALQASQTPKRRKKADGTTDRRGGKQGPGLRHQAAVWATLKTMMLEQRPTFWAIRIPDPYSPSGHPLKPTPFDFLYTYCANIDDLYAGGIEAKSTLGALKIGKGGLTETQLDYLCKALTPYGHDAYLVWEIRRGDDKGIWLIGGGEIAAWREYNPTDTKIPTEFVRSGDVFRIGRAGTGRMDLGALVGE